MRCFLLLITCKVSGCGEAPTLPSASQTPPLRGEALLYCPLKAPLPGELDAPQAQTEGSCYRALRTFRDVPAVFFVARKVPICRKVPTLPSASQTPPLRGEAFTLLPVKGSPLRGCGVERRLRRIQRDEAGAAVAECKRRSKARSMMRQPQPGKAAQRPEGSSSPAVRHLPGSSRGGVKTPPYKPTQTAYFYDTRFGRL